MRAFNGAIQGAKLRNVSLLPVTEVSPSKPRIVIVFTGGTIASTLDREFGGVVPSLSGGEILDLIPGLHERADVVVHEYGQYPGPHITPVHMLEISRIVQGYADDPSVDGIVVTHGTDTLEETAFFLDCTVATEKTVVVIGAMRNSSEPDWDGPRNLRDAIIIAAHSTVRGNGVVIALGGMINAASEVSKTDTEDLTTFASFDFGPLGKISNDHLVMHRGPLHRATYSVETLPRFVPLLKCFAGIDETLFNASRQLGCEGIVVEAFGVGNVTPRIADAMMSAVQDGLPVVLVSRCPVGRIAHTYAYAGAGMHLHKAGVIFADYLNGQKARIKLMCALGAGLSLDGIRRTFEWVDAMEGASS
jgi:L-asparaginase